MQIQADYIQQSLNKTREIASRDNIDSVEEFELMERSAGLEEALNVTLQPRQLEEVREEQENAVSRSESIKEWFKDNCMAWGQHVGSECRMPHHDLHHRS